MTEDTIYTGTVVGNPSERVLNSIPMGRTVDKTFTVPLDGSGTPYSDHRWFIITLVWQVQPQNRTALETLVFSFKRDNKAFELPEEQRDDLMIEMAWGNTQRRPNFDMRSQLIMGDAFEIEHTIIPKKLVPMSVGSAEGQVNLRPDDYVDATKLNKDQPSND